MAMLTVNTTAPTGTHQATAGKCTPRAFPSSMKPPVAKTSPSIKPIQATYTTQSIRSNCRTRPTYRASSDGKDVIWKPQYGIERSLVLGNEQATGSPHAVSSAALISKRTFCDLGTTARIE